MDDRAGGSWLITRTGYCALTWMGMLLQAVLAVFVLTAGWLV